MTGYKTKAETPYYRAVKEKLMQIAAHKGAIGQGELADALGVKVTVSFRRAMAQAEIDGFVTPFKYYGEKRGLRVGYQVHVGMIQLPLDMPPF